MIKLTSFANGEKIWVNPACIGWVRDNRDIDATEIYGLAGTYLLSVREGPETLVDIIRRKV